ncbi:PTS sugar transporter subunit IIB [Fervidobacterium pennivorans subsp. shakshaketiis]|uniref:PTS sugar transporter subunit IIB n=1 Tax=Fervidobacterium TaxID=2422 RepID=UPI00355BC54F
MANKRLKIVAVCGMGLGSSLILKMNMEKVVKELNLEADVSTTDISTAKAVISDADLIITSHELAQQLGETKAKVITIKNFVSFQEIKEALEKALKD